MDNVEVAAVALEAASRVHQKVAAGTGAGGHTYSEGKITVDRAQDRHVLSTAEAFYDWLVSKA